MSYKVLISRQVSKFLAKHNDLKEKAVSIFKELSLDYDGTYKNYNIKKMKGLVDIHRLRINKYRIIFQVENNKLIIRLIKAGNRGDIYKK